MEKKTYNTRQKDEVIKAIELFSDSHFTASDVAKALKDGGSRIGQATVYRTITKLENEGYLRKYVVDGTSAACYQAVGKSCHEHFHLKCSKCGELLHVECDELTRVASHIAVHHGFEVDYSKTVIFGLCKKCKEQK